MADPFSAPSQPLPPEFDLDGQVGPAFDEVELAGLSGTHALIKRQGRASAPPIELHIVRELTEADLPKIINRPVLGTPTNGEVVKLRSAHHRPAQLIAQGMELYDVSLITGYTVAYLSNLQNNPAFRGLIAHYSGVDDIAHVDAMKRLSALGVDAMEVLQERLEGQADEFSVRELNEIVEMAIVRPATAAMKATGQVAAANAAPRSFNVVFRSATGREAPRGTEIDGEVVK